MPRVARALADEQVYYVINRGNRRAEIFHDEYDFTKMIELLQMAKDKVACPEWHLLKQKKHLFT